MMDLWSAIGLIAWNSVLFILIGRWSVQRGPAYRMGSKILDDIQEVLERRQFVGDLTIVNTRGWYAYGYDWEINLVQKTASNGDRYDSRTSSSTLP